ncbi:cyclin-dependent kinase 4 inhibitor C [Nelusetta ayraudi]|uniref:cyclin-dependent kinase 4 inhibitor C n=1 Tax=Nelusetta ayraudi TaxID=303726 RepID=UPI003F71F430
MDARSRRKILQKHTGSKYELRILKRGAKRNKEMDIEELCNACARGDVDKVISFQNMGAHVKGFNKYNRTPIQVVQTGNTRLVRYLLEAGADPNVADPSCGRTVLHDAADAGFDDTVQVLLEYGADPNLVDAQGNRPLDLAAREGHEKVVRVLVGVTAEPERAN